MKSLIVFALMVTGTLNAQIKNLVFEGAGIRGIAYSGVIKVLEEKNLLQNVERVGGTSAGAITALFLSLGYNADEISELINSTSFKKFNDGNFLFFGGIHRLKKYYGWYRGKRFENWLDKVIQAKTGNSEISFKELHEKGYKDLFITGTSIDKQKLFVFSEETFPQMKIKDAVRISMSIPLYFEAIFMNDVGNIIKHPKNKLGLHVMVDGGLLANYPIRLFDSTKYIIITNPNKPDINPQTLGFKIEREEQIKSDLTSLNLAEFPIKKFNDYIRAFYNITIENLNRQSFSERDWERTVSISDGNISPRIKKLPAKSIELLIKNGVEATEQYFSRLSIKN
jgi:NTE family protein